MLGVLCSVRRYKKCRRPDEDDRSRKGILDLTHCYHHCGYSSYPRSFYDHVESKRDSGESHYRHTKKTSQRILYTLKDNRRIEDFPSYEFRTCNQLQEEETTHYGIVTGGHPQKPRKGHMGEAKIPRMPKDFGKMPVPKLRFLRVPGLPEHIRNPRFCAHIRAILSTGKTPR